MNMNMSLEACREECLKECSCSGYAAANVSGSGSGCLSWHGDLVDTRVFPEGGQDLYVRVDAITLGMLAVNCQDSLNDFSPRFMRSLMMFCFFSVYFFS